MALILLRHTQPDVETGICYGRTNLKLAPSFESEVSGLLAGLPGCRRIVSSPLERCARLAERIGADRNLQVRYDERIREMDFGNWEGHAWAAIPRPELDAWASNFHEARPHGGESVAMLRDRVAAALRDPMNGNAGEEDVLMVTHAGVIKAVLAVCGRKDGWSFHVEYGGHVTIHDGF